MTDFSNVISGKRNVRECTYYGGYLKNIKSEDLLLRHVISLQNSDLNGFKIQHILPKWQKRKNQLLHLQFIKRIRLPDIAKQKLSP